MRYFVQFLLVFILVLPLIQSCQKKEEGKSPTENQRYIDHGHYESEKIQKILLEELTKEGIPFKINERGSVLVPVNSLAKYLNFNRNFHYEFVQKPNGYGPNDLEMFRVHGLDECEDKKNLYIEGLDNLNIQFILRNDDRFTCNWEFQYDAKHGLEVDKLRQEIELRE